jgi:hypothetical protein
MDGTCGQCGGEWYTKFWLGKLAVRDQFEDRRWKNDILIGPKERGSWERLGLFGSEYGPMMNSCENGNEPRVSMQCRYFLD